MPPFYIGSTSIKKINNGYRGSVSSKKYKAIWNDELLLNPHLFKTIILSVHESRLMATEREFLLQWQLKVSTNPMYINEAYARKNFLYGKLGIRPSEESKEKNRLAHLGKKDSEQTRKKKSNSMKNKPKPRGVDLY